VTTPSRLPFEVAPANRYASELAIGLAGEHIVCADLLAMGYAPFRTEQAAAYDVAVDVGGRLIRLQVKATLEPRPFLQRTQRHITGYTWAMRHGKRGQRGYADGLVDGFALVALDIRRVAYIRPGRQIFQLPVSGARRLRPRQFEDYTFEQLVKVLLPG
jgi:hypothetical protein